MHDEEINTLNNSGKKKIDGNNIQEKPNIKNEIMCSSSSKINNNSLTNSDRKTRSSKNKLKSYS